MEVQAHAVLKNNFQIMHQVFFIEICYYNVCGGFYIVTGCFSSKSMIGDFAGFIVLQLHQ